ncbi:MAG: SGNH/GDSL hydrolase family protein, partial [Pseudomonadota bacterium]
MTEAPGFDRIFYFGDSLTDSDEFFAASSAVAFFGIPPTAAGYDGRFSNGPVYASLVPELIGVEGGDEQNYAVGGAQLLTDRTIGEIFAGSGLIRPDATEDDLAYRVDFKGQVARFLDEFGDEDLSGTAASIFVGLNDFNDFAPSSPEAAFDEGLAYGVTLAQTALADAAPLFAAGVDTAILNLLPDVSVFPSTQNDPPELQALGTLVSQAYNATLLEGAGQLEAAGVEVKIVDMGAIFGLVERDFGSFGFQTLDDIAVLGDNGAGGPNPAIAGIPLDQVAFFDGVHPTEAFHGIIAGYQAASLTSTARIGDDGENRMVGDRHADLAVGAEGDDAIFLRRGDDVALAGLGDDTARGGAGEDLIAGGAGDDRIGGGGDSDVIADGLGDDVTSGGAGDDLIVDGEGADLHRGGRGDDVFVFTEAALRGAEGEE